MSSLSNYKRTTTLGLLLAAMCLLGVSCNFEAPKLPGFGKGEPPSDVAPEVEAERVSMQVAVGQTFTIEFEGNETTGYRWVADHSRPNLEFIKDEYVPHEWEAPPDPETGSVPEGMVGVGGTHFFTFNAVQPRQSQIKFEYVRPWEPDRPLKVVIYDIMAK